MGIAGKPRRGRRKHPCGQRPIEDPTASGSPVVQECSQRGRSINCRSLRPVAHGSLARIQHQRIRTLHQESTTKPALGVPELELKLTHAGRSNSQPSGPTASRHPHESEQASLAGGGYAARGQDGATNRPRRRPTASTTSTRDLNPIQPHVEPRSGLVITCQNPLLPNVAIPTLSLTVRNRH